MIKTIGEWGRDPRAFAAWFGHALSSVILLTAIARLRVLDHLGDAPRSAADLAEEAGLDATQLDRLLSFLAAEGVLLVDATGCYAHTDFSRLLTGQHPASIQSVLAMSQSPLASGLALPQAVATGKTAQEVAFGMDFFALLGSDPVLAETFARFMTATTAAAEQFIMTNHAFQPFTLAVDVGGSHGSLLLRVLTLQPEANGILFDLPDVVAMAGPALAAHPSGARVETAGGSFFESVPAGGDLYLLKQILHDWPDGQCVDILRVIRSAIAPHGRLAVVDRLMPEEHRPHPAYQMDLNMLLLLGAKERKLSEFEALFARSGFRLDKVTEDPNVPSVIEAVPV
jgi:hypothetical protein